MGTSISTQQGPGLFGSLLTAGLGGLAGGFGYGLGSKMSVPKTQTGANLSQPE